MSRFRAFVYGEWPGRALRLAVGICLVLMAGCGGGYGGGAGGMGGNPNGMGMGMGMGTSAPVISMQPSSQSVAVGSTATFSVMATGTAPLSYQWMSNGGAISGATMPSYTTPSTTMAQSGTSFAVQVSNAYGKLTSSPAMLTVM